jgi:hypothetical protein
VVEVKGLFGTRDAAGQMNSTRLWVAASTIEGVTITRGAIGPEWRAVDDAMFDGFVTQLLDDGYLQESGSQFLLTWDALFLTIGTAEYATLPAMLGLPETTTARVALRSHQSLTDPDFSVTVSGWRRPDGSMFVPHLTGAILNGPPAALMRHEQWTLYKAVLAFSRRTPAERTEHHHRLAWGNIRSLALAADAILDDFLRRTVILTPERLDIGVRKSDAVANDHVVEIVPGFAGAPDDWVRHFDKSPTVRDRYDMTTPQGIVQVLVSPKVRTVLEEIKRLPQRRVAGSRAQAFILNPYATLGDDAKDVIDETQFENARASAGISYERFVPVVDRDGAFLRVGVIIETASADGPTSSEQRWLTDTEISKFVDRGERAINRGHQLIAWEGFDLEIQGDTPRHLATLKAALEERQRPQVLLSYADVHDLSAYASRVSGIGVEQPYYSPYIARRNATEGWFPDDIIPLLAFTPDGALEPTFVPLQPIALQELASALQAAKEAGNIEIALDWLPRPITCAEAEQITGAFNTAFDEVRLAPAGVSSGLENTPALGRKRLVVRPNIDTLDYEEHWRQALAAVPAEPDFPRSLRPDCVLKKHQQAGLAWLQRLLLASEQQDVRGAVLADDMGLGKTLQLLSLMAWTLEREPNSLPMLVVAPVSLLENWTEEIGKFFLPNAMPLLTAYGSGLASLRLPRAAIDERLRSEDGLVKFLRPGWVGNAKVVLTTYETLRDLEFSFAAQPWSIMVCDEAQRIKNPAAMVTRSAKKQNVRFRIACTGTPVENTLADLWCLFDFVQPGLLGPLSEFSQRYRRPIEAKTEEQRARVGELRARIAPQVLRRTKAEVAKDLPQKLVDQECRQLAISPFQRTLYAGAIDQFKKAQRDGGESPFKNHLGLLHYLRVVCTDPRPHNRQHFVTEPARDYRTKAPKLDWLIAQLTIIKSRGEKAIVFCELRDIQRLLQHYIEDAFGIRPDIINGDTSASASHVASRQRRLKVFQERPGFGIVILSPLAVGFGVNIQAANHVVHYTRTWNPAKEDQATDRAYRIGQTKDVHVYYPVVCAHDFATFDVRLDELLTLKRELAEDMLNGAADVGAAEFGIIDGVTEPAGAADGAPTAAAGVSNE